MGTITAALASVLVPTVHRGGMFDGVLCQVVGIGNESDNDKSERAKVRHTCGYACVQVISPLNLG